MPRELITIQVGQCGLQLGTRFWHLALQEHSMHSNGAPVFDESMSSFFRNLDTRRGLELHPQPDEQMPIYSLRARAVLVDMEEGVLSQVRQGPIAELFDTQQLIQDVSGSGNNWAHGHEVYGPQYAEQIAESVRVTAESCDSLQSFFFLHSLGGGTGSGLGTYILEMLSDEYPDVYRFTSCVFPSEDSDVITSPYNSLLSLRKLLEFADCVLPVENQSLQDICALASGSKKKRGSGRAAAAPSAGGVQVLSKGKGKGKRGSKKKGDEGGAFDAMNTLAASVLTDLTCSMRFEGALNVDLNEITMNLVPYPGMHFIVPASSPLIHRGSADPRMRGPRRHSQARSIDHMFTDVFSHEHQLLKVRPKQHTFLASGLIARGDVQISDMSRNIERLRPSLNMIHWNEDGFKIGLCATPPLSHPHSLLGLANNSCIGEVFASVYKRFARLYRRKAHLHHYTEYMEEALFGDAAEHVQRSVLDYQALDKSQGKRTKRPSIL